jgi:tetratricopeptide (TPR) repeat protein
LLAIVTLLVLASACAQRSDRPIVDAPAPPPAVDVAALIRRGCYRCLEEALAAAQAQGQPADAFEAAVLLAVRAKELGIPAGGWLERARAIAPGLPEAAAYLEIADLLPPDPMSGMPRRFGGERERQLRSGDPIAPWRAALEEGSASGPFRAYLRVALTCAYPGEAPLERVVPATAGPELTVPLVAYRAGVCAATFQETLLALRAADDRLADAEYQLGIYQLSDRERPDQDAALVRFDAARAAFPESPAVAARIGQVRESREEWDLALAAYDAALALAPQHPDALLGRTVSLSYLRRHQEAIQAATTIVDLRGSLLGPAHYWRAWNHFNSENYPSARADADRMLQLMANASAYLLSGLIHWRQGSLAAAEGHLQEALTMDFGACEAARSLGYVRAERNKAPEAAAALQQARQCYDLSIKVREEMIATITRGPGTDADKGRRIAIQQRAIRQADAMRADVTKSWEKLDAYLRAQAARTAAPVK